MTPHQNLVTLLKRFEETSLDDSSYDITEADARALAVLGYLKRPFKNRLFYTLTGQGLEAIRKTSEEWLLVDSAPLNEYCLLYSGSRGVFIGSLHLTTEASCSPENPVGSVCALAVAPDPWGECRVRATHWMPLPVPPQRAKR